VARAEHCTWFSTALRGIYRASCVRYDHVMGVPICCPECGRPVHMRGRVPGVKHATMADYQRWKALRAHPQQEKP
jgi:primosomal protein N'